MTAEAGEALHLEVRDDGLAVLRIDVPGTRLNLLRPAFVDELDAMLDRLEALPELRAVVVTSGRPDHFVAGADLRALQNVRFASEGAELAYLGQTTFARIESFRAPVVAAIHGTCVGAGLELALSCHARVASADANTRLGLPEVKLGLIPGLGGTQRLPRLVGLAEALNLLLSGKRIGAAEARRIGLVDEVVPAPILLEVAARMGRERAGQPRPKPHPGLVWGLVGMRDGAQLRLRDNVLARTALLVRARRKLLAQTRGNYPAPERILDVVRTGLDHGMARGLQAEARAFGELVTSPQAARLIDLFFVQRQLRKDRGVDDPNVAARPVRAVGVVGAGVMGSAIAYVTATRAELPVRLRDRDTAGVGEGLRAIGALADQELQRGRLSPEQRRLVAARVSAAVDYSGFAGVDVVIEATWEELALKRQILAEVETQVAGEVIFASNTSSLPISRLAEGCRYPERVVGMHYFHPAQRMPLLELVVAPRTAPWVVATCTELGKRQGKTVIVVRDGPGFYTARILSPYLAEASHLVAEGLPVERVDAALADWGFPTGPIALLDDIGIDVCRDVTAALREAFGERLAPPPAFERLLEDERRGRKSQRGFYRYDRGRRRVDGAVYALLGVVPKADLPSGDIVQRCVLRMVNEASRCLAEQVLRSAGDGDVAAIWGLGFPPFRGGPFRYVDEVGAEEIVRRLRAFERQLGSRFEPAPLLVSMAESGATFHPRS